MDRADKQAGAVEQHSAARSLTLHLLPGALITIFYALIVPVVRSLGFPSLMAIFLSILIVLVPFELGYLLYRSRHENGDFSLRNVVQYRERTPTIQLVALVIPLFVWSGIFAVLLYPPLDAFFVGNFFSWLPDWFFFAEDFSRTTGYNPLPRLKRGGILIL